MSRINWARFKNPPKGLFPPEGWNEFIAALQTMELTDFTGGEISSKDANGTKLASRGGAGTSVAVALPFQIVPFLQDGDTPAWRIVTSTMAGQLPDGFNPGDDPSYILTGLNDGDVIYGVVTYDLSGEEPILAYCGFGADADIPADDVEGGTWYVRLGSVRIIEGVPKAVNDRYGPIGTDIYPVWFSFPLHYDLKFY